MLRTALALSLALGLFLASPAVAYRTLLASRRPLALRARVVAYQSKDETGGMTEEDVDPPPHEAETPEEVAAPVALTPCKQIIGDDDNGYGLPGTLVRQGPTAFFARILSPVDYEMGVQKFMLARRVTRREAQGNLDAVLADPNSWLLEELHAQSAEDRNTTHYLPDYANANVSPRALMLSGVWALIITAVFLRIFLVGWPTYVMEHPDWQMYFARSASGIPNIFA
jgi:hypothetical protein